MNNGGITTPNLFFSKMSVTGVSLLCLIFCTTLLHTVRAEECLLSETCLLQTQFEYEDNWNDCHGQQYVTKTTYGPYLGVVLCTRDRYKLFMSLQLNETFRNIADGSGHGQDHCELLGSSEDRANLPNHFWDSPTAYGYYRSQAGEAFQYAKIGFGPSDMSQWTGKYYVRWYECGVPIPGNHQVVQDISSTTSSSTTAATTTTTTTTTTPTTTPAPPICDPGKYGINCAEDCSAGCEDTCNHVLGTCSCHQWWTGSKCETEIRAFGVLASPPTATSVTDSSAVIRWKKIANVPARLSDNNQYVIEYKEETSSSWGEWQPRHSHDPSSDQYQEATLTGLKYNTVYDIRVKSYRVLGDDREGTGTTEESTFKTLCRAPDKPGDLKVTHEQNDKKITLVVNWQKPDSGCSYISGSELKFRLLSTSGFIWQTVEVGARETSVSIPNLDPGEYIVRVTIINNQGLYNDNTKEYAAFLDYDTDCSKCVDSDCVSTSPCQTCQAGYRQPECRKAGENGGAGGLGTGPIVGIVIGSFVGIVLVGVAVGCLLYRTRRLRQAETQQYDSKTPSHKQNDLKKQGPKSATTNLEETHENPYEIPHVYENATEVMKTSEYETLP